MTRRALWRVPLSRSAANYLTFTVRLRDERRHGQLPRDRRSARGVRLLGDGPARSRGGFVLLGARIHTRWRPSRRVSDGWSSQSLRLEDRRCGGYCSGETAVGVPALHANEYPERSGRRAVAPGKTLEDQTNLSKRRERTRAQRGRSRRLRVGRCGARSRRGASPPGPARRVGPEQSSSRLV